MTSSKVTPWLKKVQQIIHTNCIKKNVSKRAANAISKALYTEYANSGDILSYKNACESLFSEIHDDNINVVVWFATGDVDLAMRLTGILMKVFKLLL